MTQPQSISTRACLWCGILAATSVGCQTYSPYGYGGYSGGYPTYNQGGQIAPYGATGVPPGSTVMPIPQNGYPNGSYPGTGAVTPATPYPNVPGQGYPQGVDSSGGNLGTPGQFPDSGSTSRPKMPKEEERLVPNYNDPASPAVAPNPKRPAAPSVDVGDPGDFNSELNGSQKSTEKLKKMETSEIPHESAMLDADLHGAEFTPPVTRHVSTAGASGIIQTAQHVDARHGSHELRPYGRAANGRAWFRGLVDFDEQENAWYLIYNPEPDASDKQGGTITLVEHPNLKLFKGDDVVLVEGDFDPTVTDRYGNAKYRATVIRRLIP